MPPKELVIDHLALLVDPLRQALDMHQPQFVTRPGQAKMRDQREGQSTAPHNAVRWRARPTRLDRETSHPETSVEPRPDHCRRPVRKTVRFLAFYFQMRAAGLQVDGDLDKGVEKPVAPDIADGVIRGLEPQIFDDLVPPRGMRTGRRGVEQLRPFLVEFGHMARIGRQIRKGNFVVLF